MSVLGTSLSKLSRGSAISSLVLVIAFLLTLGFASSSVSASQLRMRHCRTIAVDDEFHPRVNVTASHLPCRKARRIITAYLDGPESEKELVGPDDYNGYIRLKRFPGYRCTSGAGAGGCRKGRHEAGWDWFSN